MIEKIIPGTNTKLRILKIIYEDSPINVTSLIKKAKTSPNLVLSYINNLNNFDITKEEKFGGKKKIHIRNLMPNFESDEAKLLYSLIEFDKKIIFLEKYKKLKFILKQIYELIEKNIAFIIIYGSYARFAATKESDLDLLIVGKLNEEKIKRLKEIFILQNPQPSIKIESLKQFKSNLNKPLYQNIIKEHIILYGSFNFMSINNSK